MTARKRQSRVIGAFLKNFLKDQDIRCSDYPTLSIVRTTPPGQQDLVWTFGQLAECYDITEAYHIEAENVEVKDETGTYKIDYLAIVINREGDRWGEPQVQSNIEEIYPGLDEQKLLERFERFGRRAGRAILVIVGVAESVKRSWADLEGT